MNDALLASQIHDMALSCGYDDCGIIPIDYMGEFSDYLQKRIVDVPLSAFFYQAIGASGGTRDRFPWAKSVVVCTLWLGKYRFPASLQGKYAKNLFLSSDNEPCSAFRKSLEQLEVWFTEHGIRAEGGRQFGARSIGPLRHAAMMAGLGIIRKNNFFYTENGSFIELIGYVIDRSCMLVHTPALKPCSEKCDLCQKNCPSGALKGPFAVNPLECVSFLTTFGKGELMPGMDEGKCGEWICGCDSCQDACPYNRRHDWTKGTAYPGLEELESELQPETLLKQSDAFLQKHVIPYTDNHVGIEETETLRICAARSLRNQADV